MTFVNILKRLILGPVRRVIKKTKTFIRRSVRSARGADWEYKGMSTKDVFENIYRVGAWGQDEDGNSTSGPGSHHSRIIEPYINMVQEIIAEKKPATLVDIGCGDLNVGRNFFDLCEKYYACDISENIIERNRIKYKDATHVEFLELDLSKDDVPGGDIGFVRQVLQHLANDNIHRFVREMNEKKPFKYLLVTEHISANPDFRPNLDKRSGANIRAAIKSGVVLHEAPFFLEHKSRRDLLEIEERFAGPAVIKSVLYEL